MSENGRPAALRPSQNAMPGRGLFGLVIALFFLMGGIVSLNDLLTPKLKSLFALNYTEAMLINVCFFMAYGLISIPAAQLVKLVGYLRSVAIGLGLMVIGCLLFIPATQFLTYPLFLMALFVLASGHVVVQVVLNPLASLLGSPETAPTRLTLAQAFNSLGMVAFPKIFGTLVLGSFTAATGAALCGVERDACRWSESRAVLHVYLVAAAALAVAAAMVWAHRNRLHEERHTTGSIRQSLDLLRIPRFAGGALCICLYVGAEITIASILVNYIQLPRVLGASAAQAAWFIPIYWGAALLGRFAGAAFLSRMNPGTALSLAGCGALMLIALSAYSTGAAAVWSIVAIGLMNAIMFPTIFSLACHGLGDRAAAGSGLINMAICGGAAVTLSTGRLADVTGSLTLSLAVPALCYGAILAFGWRNRNAQPVS
ncbi:sugar MFS transporter [Novosphingobium sp.]|uniref:sugar MFS transporter n=1 Tax=Novosphingobium sp. TaxID=1874826 RepID=UPI00260B91F6|nr:sugar MFS transporter [Novosphingobium sp.]